MLILLLNQIVSLFLVQLVDAVLVLLQVKPQDGVDVSAYCRVLRGDAVDYLQDDAVDTLLIYTHCRVLISLRPRYSPI